MAFLQQLIYAMLMQIAIVPLHRIASSIEGATNTKAIVIRIYLSSLNTAPQHIRNILDVNETFHSIIDTLSRQMTSCMRTCN